MQFKTKDLLVTVLPKAEFADADQAKLCLLQTVICRHPTIIDCHLSCLFRGSFCGYCSRFTCGICSLAYSGGGCHFFNSCGGPGGSACDYTYFCPGGSRDPFVIQNLEDLATLKAELQTTLKSLDAIQKEGLPSSIGSKSEAEALERGLTEALEQVRAARKKL